MGLLRLLSPPPLGLWQFLYSHVLISTVLSTPQRPCAFLQGSLSMQPSPLQQSFLQIVLSPQTLSSKSSTQAVHQLPPGFPLLVLWPRNSLGQSAAFRLEGYPSRLEAEACSSGLFLTPDSFLIMLSYLSRTVIVLIKIHEYLVAPYCLVNKAQIMWPCFPDLP